MKSLELVSRIVLVIAFSLSSGCMRDIRSDSGINSYVINTDNRECESHWSASLDGEFQRLVKSYGDQVTVDEQLNGYEGIPGIVRVVNITEPSHTYTPYYSNNYYPNSYFPNSYYTNRFDRIGEKRQVVLFDGLVSDCMAVAKIYENKSIRQAKAAEKEKIQLAKLEEEQAREMERRRIEQEKIEAKNKEYFALKEDGIASTATWSIAEDNVSEAYSATFSDHCKTLPGYISFEFLRSKIYQLASEKPDDYRVMSDKEYPGGIIFSFISPDGGGNVTNNLDFCKILLMEIINETNKNIKDNSSISKNEIWVADGKKLRCVRAKPLEPYDRLKWVLRDEILIQDSNAEGRTIIAGTEGQSVIYVDNEQLCRSIIAAGTKQNFSEQIRH